MAQDDGRTSLLDRVSIWWRGEAPVRQASIVRAPEPRRVPTEYRSLYAYLEGRYATSVVLTFEQMEALMGHPLPDPARTDAVWWTGDTRTADGHSDAWTVASRTASPNFGAQTVTFERLQ